MTAKELLARGPRYIGGVLMDSGRNWSPNDREALRVLAEANVDPIKAAEILGRPEKSLVWRAQGDRLKVPPAWRKIIAPRTKPKPRWTPLAYPYVNFRRAETETLLAVNQMVSQALPGREDVCQDVMLAILEQGLTPDRETVNRFIRKFKRENYEGGGYALSLDASIGDWDHTIADTLAGESSFEYWNRM